MAFTRQSFKGNNSVEPADTNKQGQGSEISNTGLDDTLANKKSLPGAFNLSQMTGVNFTEIPENFNKDNISRWFRDDGNTTT
tara:strand:- start:5018 stop:5263 length:246 start_codon:yes stop_codon:yes gene_type:complete